MRKISYLKLFINMFYISAFTFGGGYVIVSLMQKKFVDDLKWFSEDEMLNLTAIAQSAPGPVAINTSIMVGFKIGGVLGAVLSITATILPPLIIISVISMFYVAFRSNIIVASVLKGMQAGVSALIADVAINLSSKVFRQKDWIFILLMFISFAATFIFNVNVMYIIIFSAIIGSLKIVFQKNKTQGDNEK